VATFKDTDAEAISFTVSSASPVVGRPLKQVDFPEGTIVAAIIRGETVIVPRGTDQLQTGDTAIIFALQNAVEPVTKLFPS
jgi:trk system potassium uptake protein TrkA